MKNYVKPMVVANDSLAESVYMASGEAVCYTFTANIVQTPENGRPSYTIQMDGVHASDHYSTSRTVLLTFNQPVQYVSSNAAQVSGDGTANLSLTFTDGTNGSYFNNPNDNIGLGQLVVTSADGLAITGTYCTFCNETK